MSEIGFELWEKVKIFLRPCSKEKDNFEKWDFGIGVLKQFGITCTESLLKSLHPNGLTAGCSVCEVWKVVLKGGKRKWCVWEVWGLYCTVKSIKCEVCTVL